jgi:hypothetical protein
VAFFLVLFFHTSPQLKTRALTHEPLHFNSTPLWLGDQ